MVTFEGVCLPSMTRKWRNSIGRDCVEVKIHREHTLPVLMWNSRWEKTFSSALWWSYTSVFNEKISCAIVSKDSHSIGRPSCVEEHVRNAQQIHSHIQVSARLIPVIFSELVICQSNILHFIQCSLRWYQLRTNFHYAITMQELINTLAANVSLESQRQCAVENWA